MKDLNPGSSKCRDVIMRLCGSSLNLDSESRSLAFVNSQLGSGLPDEGAAGSTPNWMAEVDTAIYQYDVDCDRIGGADMAKIDWAAMGAQDWDWGLLE
jgi:hypothetical protein